MSVSENMSAFLMELGMLDAFSDATEKDVPAGLRAMVEAGCAKAAYMGEVAREAGKPNMNLYVIPPKSKAAAYEALQTSCEAAFREYVEAMLMGYHVLSNGELSAENIASKVYEKVYGALPELRDRGFSIDGSGISVAAMMALAFGAVDIENEDGKVRCTFKGNALDGDQLVSIMLALAKEVESGLTATPA